MVIYLNSKKFAILMGILVLEMVFISGVWAISRNAGTSGAVFLRAIRGTRLAATGGAAVAQRGDVQTVPLNPSSLLGIENNQIYLEHNKSFVGINYEFLSYGRPVGDRSYIGTSVTLVSSGDIQRTTIANPSGAGLGSFDASDLAVSFSGAYRLRVNWGLGATAKFIRSRIDDASASAVAVDLGANYQTPLKSLRLAASLRNLGSNIKFDLQSDPLPLEVVGGLAYQLPLRNAKDKFSFFLDVHGARDRGLGLNLGSEYDFYHLLQFRIGYNLQNDAGSGLSLGAGFHYRAISLDYAYIPFAQLGDQQRVGVKVAWGAKRKLTVYSPTDKTISIFRKNNSKELTRSFYQKTRKKRHISRKSHEKFIKLKKTISSSSGDVRLASSLRKMAVAEYRQKNYFVAREYMKRINSFSAVNAKDMAFLAAIEMRTGEYQEAQRNLETAVRLSSHPSPDWIFNLGVSQFKNGNAQKALQSWKKVLELSPRHPLARRNVEKLEAAGFLVVKDEVE